MNFQLYFKKLFRIILMLFFRFDYWHTSPLDNRKYAIDIISKLNRRASRESLIEIGCGLGDILTKAHYDRKYFYDISPEVLSAAAFLQKFSKISSINMFCIPIHTKIKLHENCKKFEIKDNNFHPLKKI